MAAPLNLARYVLAAGRDRPDHPALEVLGAGGPSLTHGALADAVARRAGGLAASGLAPGARVMLRLGDTPDFPVTFLACAAAGLVPVPTSAQLTAAEIGPMAERIDPALVVADGPGGGGIALPPGRRVAEAAALDGPALPPEAWPEGDPDRLGYVVFTSGSGGAPKAVAHAHRAVPARRAMWDGWYGLRADDRMLHAGAFNWTYTLGTGLLDPWAAGATALIPAPGTPAAALPGLLAAHGATILAAAPGVYRRILRGPVPPLPALRHGLSAGEALPPALRAAWRDATGTDLHEALGMSECSTFVSGSPARPAPEGWAGYPQPGRRVRVEGGRLQVGADDPGLMLGYWEDGAPRRPEGAWIDTGDLAEAAPDGAIRHLGRADDVLNPGGYRVSPAEVEAALADLPVAELAVGQRTLEGGATVLVAYYVGAPLDEAAADAHAAARLARYKRPRMWLRREALPRNPNGKLVRRRLG